MPAFEPVLLRRVGKPDSQSRDGHRSKVRYNHRAGPRAGIEIVEVLRGREGPVAVSITSLDDAEEAYQLLEKKVKSFMELGH